MTSGAPGGAPHTMIALHDAPATTLPLDEALWAQAATLPEFIAGDIQNVELWRTTERLARLAPEQAARAAALPPARMLVLLEDWCGDAIYTVPFAQRIADANPALALRVLPRDRHDALMALHLSGAARSIPVVMAFDARGIERGWWGPRPSPLQAWMLAEGLAMEKAARYKAVRTWYARDRGSTTVHELLTLLERTATTAQESPAANPV